MDITNLTQNLIKGLEQKNIDQLVTLSRLLNLALGKVVMANVTDISPVTPQERDALLAKTVEDLLQSNKAASVVNLTPALKAEISRLMDQQLLISSPNLKWVTFQVNNQSLLTYTDKPLTSGQAVSLQLTSPQKLSLLDLPEISNAAHKQQAIADSLRQLLPLKDARTDLFATLAKWQNTSTVNQLISPTLEQALKNVIKQFHSPSQLSQPKVLEQAIKNSGVFFENKLSANLATRNGASLDRTYTQDLKGSLLKLLTKVNQELTTANQGQTNANQNLTGNNKSLSTQQTVKLLEQLGGYIPTTEMATATLRSGDALKNILPNDISLLLQQLMTKPTKELSDKELRTQLLVLLQQHSLQSLAKIQLQQLMSLHHEVNNKDSAQPTNSWQLEIPVKYHNEVQQLHLHIEREWVDAKNSHNENKPPTKVKQWSVMLRFDLPTLGEFCAQLAIIDTSVSATLWAAQETTLTQVRQHMENLQKNLEKEGIYVKQLQCIKGTPVQKPTALNYSLINIST